MRILIADDHAMLRQGLMQTLADEFTGAKFGEAGSTQETTERLAQGRWDVLVLDIFMPGRGGLEVLREVKQTHPRLPVLVLSSAPEEQLTVRVLKAGAAGYVNKQAAADELVGAVRKVMAGGKYVSGKLAELLAAQAGRAADAPLHAALSDREFQVLRMLVAGQSLKEIAAALSLSAKTISTFHTRIWTKLGVRSDVELVLYAMENGLVERGE
jgi:DNA-binding NarL/FixJ family response regulator